MHQLRLPQELLDPPHQFSVMPFWFWNDDLDADELIRQIDDFVAHGVYGFVIHPRVGLPRTLGWMSDRLLDFYQIAIDAAAQRNLRVILYDEGMYPSGSSAGQVVAENPAYQTRCLDKIELDATTEIPRLPADQTLVAVVDRADGSRIAVIDRVLDAFIRGIHYIDDGPAEDEPPAADLLNPAAVDSFIRHVYDGFAARFAPHFGKTIMAIFTDEPSPVGRPRERGIWPGTTGILAHVNRILGYDFTPHLPALWYDDEPDAARYRRDYERAIALRMEETWYQRLYEWCSAHGLPLTGHPARADDMGAERYFHMPGQDLVWRWVLPDDPTALEGPESTQGKCSASAALHHARARNVNECCGAYGHELTWDEMSWLARWCFVRGVNLLIPHAFYYSVRGIRRDERPPDVGPNSPWWDRYREYADSSRRLSWLNTDCEHQCDIAILGEADFLPWRTAKVCFQHQRDFNYVEARDLVERAQIAEDGIHLAGMHYKVLLVEHAPDAATLEALAPLRAAGRVLMDAAASPVDTLLARVDALVAPDVTVSPPTPALRVRHIRKAGFDWYMLFNEERVPRRVRVTLAQAGARFHFDAVTGESVLLADDDALDFAGYELKVIGLARSDATADN